MQTIIHLANALYLTSYLVRDILKLRIITVIAIFCLFPYFYFQPRPLYEAIIWNALFVVINLYQIYLLYIERRPVVLTAEEERLYRLAFRCLTRQEFKKLLAEGEWRLVRPKELLIRQGAEPDEIAIVVTGDVCVYVDKEIVAHVKPGQFLGEMGFFTGNKTTADVWSDSEVRIYSWKLTNLMKFLATHPSIRTALQVTLGKDLTAKLGANP